MGNVMFRNFAGVYVRVDHLNAAQETALEECDRLIQSIKGRQGNAGALGVAAGLLTIVVAYVTSAVQKVSDQAEFFWLVFSLVAIGVGLLVWLLAIMPMRRWTIADVAELQRLMRGSEGCRNLVGQCRRQHPDLGRIMAKYACEASMLPVAVHQSSGA